MTQVTIRASPNSMGKAIFKKKERKEKKSKKEQKKKERRKEKVRNKYVFHQP